MRSSVDSRRGYFEKFFVPILNVLGSLCFYFLDSRHKKEINAAFRIVSNRVCFLLSWRCGGGAYSVVTVPARSEIGVDGCPQTD